MTVLTAGQQTTIRQRPHRARLYLTIYQPRIAYTARINQPGIARGTVTINFNNTAGTLSDVLPGMTVLVGDTNNIDNADDLGRIRLRSIVAGQMVVAENSIVWQDQAYLTFVRFFEPWGVYPRIVGDVNNVPTFYKDYDIVYTDQNSNLDPVPMMGPNMAAMLDPVTGLATLYFDGSLSYCLSSSITGFLWTFEGATTTTSTLQTPGNIQWGKSGDFIVSLQVTAANGKVFTGYRHICIRTQLGGTNPPIVSWGTDGSLSGDYSKGDWEGRIWMLQGAGKGKVANSAIALIFADTWYGSSKINFGGNYPNRENQIFSGYVRSGSVVIDPESSKVTFTITNLGGRLSAEEIYAVSVESKASPATWYEVQNMTVDIALYHYIRWHTTIYSIADVRPNGHSNQVQFADFERSPMYRAIDGFISSTYMGRFCIDRQGQAWLEKKVDIVPVGAERNPGTIMQLTRADWMNAITINQVRETPVSYVEIDGIHYDGPAAGTFTSLISIAPGTAPLYEGTVQVNNGMVLENQTVTNQLAGDALADANKQFKEVTFDLVGAYTVFDIAPQERVQITLAAIDSYLRLVWNNKNFIPRRINFSYTVEEQSLMVSLTVEEETSGVAGIPGPYPGIPPVAPPPTPPPPPPPPFPGPSSRPVTALLAAVGTHVVLATNFESPTVSYSDLSTGLSGTVTQIVTDLAHGSRAFCLTSTGIYRNNNVFIGSSWTLLYTAANVASALGVPYACTITSIACDPTRAGFLVFTAGYNSNYPTNDGYYYIFHSPDAGTTISVAAALTGVTPGVQSVDGANISFGATAGTGLVSGQSYQSPSPGNSEGRIWIFSNDGTTIVSSAPVTNDSGGAGVDVQHTRGYASDVVMLWPTRTLTLYFNISRTNSLGSDVDSFTPHYGIGVSSQICAIEPTGTVFMGMDFSNHFHISTTGGSLLTWSDLGLVSYTVNCIINLADSINNWARAGSSAIEFSADKGLTWSSRAGNLAAVIGGAYSVGGMAVLLALIG